MELLKTFTKTQSLFNLLQWVEVNIQEFGEVIVKEKLATYQPYILSSIFSVWTIIIAITVYKDLDYPYVFQVVIGYVIFLLLFALYYIILFVRKVVKLKSLNKRKRFGTFSKCFFVISLMYIIQQYFFTRSGIDWAEVIFKSTVISLLSTFIDVFFKEETEKQET